MATLISSGTLLILSLCIFLSNAQLPQQSYNVTQLITSWGYPCIDHSVITDDGYVLSVQNMQRYGAPPVYLQHGVLDSSATWVINNPQESLAFILYDAGFDVWLGNSRGNTYCQSNINFSNDTQQFWNYSWDQLAQYDLPAKIEYILSYSNYSTLSYVGHSEGTLIAFTEFSRNPALAAKVNLFVALAPIVYLSNVGDLAQLFADIPPIVLEDIFGTMSIGEIWSELGTFVTDTCVRFPESCLVANCAVAGCELDNINKTNVPVIFSHYPAGTSVQNMMHYQQAVNTGTYQMYDYGATLNQQYYGQPTPPPYSLSTFNTSLALFYGSHDKFSDPTDVATLISQLPYPPVFQEEVARYGHSDFVWGEDAHRKVYSKIVSLIQTAVKNGKFD